MGNPDRNVAPAGPMGLAARRFTSPPGMAAETTRSRWRAALEDAGREGFPTGGLRGGGSAQLLQLLSRSAPAS